MEILKDGYFLVFLIFSVGTIGAVILASKPKYRWTRNIYIAFLGSAVLLAGILGVTVWPFFSWNLYPTTRTDNINFYEIRVEDIQGKEIKYDARAAPPTLATPIGRYANRMVEKWEERESKKFAKFLLRRGELYRQEVIKGDLSFFSYIKFPRHQYGFKWRHNNISDFSQLESLHIYKITVEFSDNGKRVEQKRETKLKSYTL